MNVLIIGSGGREHALAWKLHQSSHAPKLFIAPGNGGTAEYGTNIPIDAGDVPALMDCITQNSIDFVIPGPELPLVNGIVDTCQKAGVLCFGPDAYAARLEGSKIFSKEIMRASGVPTADFAVFGDYTKAAAHVRQKGAPLVIKADGLAAGKGVVVAKTLEEALEALEAMMVHAIFGPAGKCVVIEDALEGEEASFLAFCQGDTVIPLPSAQDHKAVNNDDKGPNTGGMGAYSPAPVLPESDYQRMVDVTIKPVLAELAKQGHPFNGILYAGLMMTKNGVRVIEYNVRFGDPECQPLLMRLEGDLLEVMLACAQGHLDTATLAYTHETALCVVLAAKGYPGAYAKGMPIAGIGEAEATCPGKVKVFQAGTALKDEKPVASGGRVLGITALGETLLQAQQRAYEAVKHITMENSHYRTDIGNKGLR